MIDTRQMCFILLRIAITDLDLVRFLSRPRTQHLTYREISEYQNHKEHSIRSAHCWTGQPLFCQADRLALIPHSHAQIRGTLHAGKMDC